MTRDEPPAHPLQGVDGDPPPPRREQLPLPQRDQMSHLEPQLRTPHSPGEGTPFAAFDAPRADTRRPASGGPAATPPRRVNPATPPAPRPDNGHVRHEAWAEDWPADRTGPMPMAFPPAAFREGSRRAADRAPTPPPPPARRPARPHQQPSPRPRRPCGRD